MEMKKVYEENYISSQKKIVMSLKKKRNISTNKFSLTGQITSLKRNDQVDFESSLERDYIHLLEFDDEVRIYYEQPLKIEFAKRYYIPDFYVEYWDGKIEIVEIKYSTDLIENAKSYNAKFKAAEEFCKENNLSFKILTEKDIRSDYLFNVKFLQNIRMKHAWIEPEYFNEFELLKKYMDKLKKTTPNELLDHCTSCNYKRSELIQYLWFMIMFKKIKTDLTKKLNMESKIWI